MQLATVRTLPPEDGHELVQVLKTNIVVQVVDVLHPGRATVSRVRLLHPMQPCSQAWAGSNSILPVDTAQHRVTAEANAYSCLSNSRCLLACMLHQQSLLGMPVWAVSGLPRRLC
jgi:hypothetical protein